MVDDDGLPLDEVGRWAKQKHQRLYKYVDISRAVRRKFLGRSGCATYIDLFCGSGRAFIHETEEIIDGSPLVAFKCARNGGAPFSEIHIADVDESRCNATATRITNEGGTAIGYVGKAENTVSEIVTRLNPYPIASAQA